MKILKTLFLERFFVDFVPLFLYSYLLLLYNINWSKGGKDLFMNKHCLWQKKS